MERLRFFLAEFHGGIVNQVAHFFAFGLLGYGVATGNLWLVVASGPAMLLGNLFNYAAGRYRGEFWETLPLQVGGWFLSVLLAYTLSSFIS